MVGELMKPLTKYMWRNIRGSLGRFIAIVLIIMLGVITFVGVKATGPALNDSLNKTVKDLHLSDVQLMSSTGFTKQDVKTAEKVAGAQAEAVKFKYVTGGADSYAVALYGYNAANQQNQLALRTGYLPKNQHQIVLDYRAQEKYGYHLGQHFTFDRSAKLRHRTYTIVGFADSPSYIDSSVRGSANVGDGTVKFFAYIPASQMNLTTATLLNVSFKKLQHTDTFSDQYDRVVDRRVAQLKTVFKARAKARSAALLKQAAPQLATQQQQLDQARQQLVASGVSTAQAKQQLQPQQAQLNAALQKAQRAVKTTYTWQTRDDLPGFAAYGESSDRIAAIANVFPVFFFLVAALITFTTITRMVEEARAQIGTFKALGYSKTAIARNYLNYAFLAGMIGTVIGAFVGNLSLPRLVLSLYRSYIPLTAVVHLQWGLFGISLLVAMLTTVGAALLVVRRELEEKPAELMRPRSPKSAKRVLLEKITPLWRRLNFNQKVSYRNMFRYKSRMLMTIIGIAGGTGLILTGYGIQNSIGASGTKQYGEVVKYQALVRLAHDDQDHQAVKILQNNAQYRRHTQISANVGDVRSHGHKVDDVNIFVPSSTKQIKQFIRLRSTENQHAIQLQQHGVVLSEKMAQKLNVQVGDSVKVTTTDHDHGTAKITAITQNYVGDYLYASPAAYRHLFGQTTTYNTLLVSLKHQTQHQRDQLAHRLLKDGDTQGTSYTSDQRQTITTMSGSLDTVVLIFILLSGVLSFVVLYNLTNINVSERIRELSTIKVLGFYDREVTMYIVRENIMLTLIGIVLGYGVGNLLTAYILHQAATDQVIFPLTIYWPGYVVATLLMVAFTVIVMGVTHRRLKRVDMVSALKSNE